MSEPIPVNSGVVDGIGEVSQDPSWEPGDEWVKEEK